MNEGWCADEYLALFSDAEIEEKTRQYKLEEYLPGFRIIGLRGWDDFIVMDSAGILSTVPTVPPMEKYRESFSLPAPLLLSADERIRGKIKWYITPIVFGGDPNMGENITWLSHESHVQVVVWWNKKYKALTSGKGNA